MARIEYSTEVPSNSTFVQYSSRDVNRYLEENVPLMKEPPREQVGAMLVRYPPGMVFNSSIKVEKEAELKAHYFLRASGRQVIEPLMTIGWRKNKFFWLITDFDPEQRKMLEVGSGPVCYSDAVNLRCNDGLLASASAKLNAQFDTD